MGLLGEWNRVPVPVRCVLIFMMMALLRLEMPV
jgi:hypothetical protein